MPHWVGSCLWYLWLAFTVFGLIFVFSPYEGDSAYDRREERKDRYTIFGWVFFPWFLYFMFHYVMWRGG